MPLTRPERTALERLIADPSASRRRVLRARIALAASDGEHDRSIAEREGVSLPTVRLWRARYASSGIAGLDDLQRSGRPRVLGASPPTRAAGEAADASEDGVDHLLEAATRTIARRGFAATRVTDIAAEAGVSPAAVHYHFKAKEELLVRALLWAHERLIVELEDALTTTDDPVARLAMLIERTVPYTGVQRDEYLLEIDLWAHVRQHRQLLPQWERYEERWMGHVTAMVEAGIAAGEFTCVTPAPEVAERLVAMADGLSAQASIGASRMPPERVRDLLLRFAAEQLGVPVERLERAARLPGFPRRRA